MGVQFASKFVDVGKVYFFGLPASQRHSYASFGTFKQSWPVAFMLQEELLVAT